MFKHIAVVDDKPENRQAAAQAIQELLPSTKVSLFCSAAEILETLQNQSTEIDLVLSDMDMEDRWAGHRVAVESWAWGIPATIITGGIGHGRDYVYLSYPSRRLDDATKTTLAVWKKVLQYVLEGDTSTNGLITQHQIGRRLAPNYEHGRTCADVTAIDRS